MASVTSGTALIRKLETSFGTTPATTLWHPMRITGENLQPNMRYTESQEIRPDGQIAANVRVGGEGGGPINGELPFGEWDDWMAASLLSGGSGGDGWETAGSNISTVSATAAAGTVPTKFTVPSGGFPNLAAGDWFHMNLMVPVTMQGLWKCVGITGNDLWAQGMVSANSSVDGTIVLLDQVANGTTLRSWHVERQDTDDTDEFHLTTGLGVNGMQVEIPEGGEIIRTTWETVSKIGSSPGTSASTTQLTKNSDEPMAAATVFKFYEGDVELTNVTTSALNFDESPFKGLSMTLTQTPNLRTRDAWGTIGPALEHGRGDHTVTGQVRLYYNEGARDDRTLFQKVTSGTDSSSALIVNDGLAQFYIFDLPRLKFTGGTRNSPAKSEDVILTLEFRCSVNTLQTNFHSAITGVTMAIFRGQL